MTEKPERKIEKNGNNTEKKKKTLRKPVLDVHIRPRLNGVARPTVEKAYIQTSCLT